MKLKEESIAINNSDCTNNKDVNDTCQYTSITFQWAPAAKPSCATTSNHRHFHHFQCFAAHVCVHHEFLL